MEPDATANYHSNLYVKGLPLDADEDQLVSLFGEHGDVQSVRIFRSMQNPNKAPFAFVKLATVEAAHACIAALNGELLAPGSVIDVRFADNDSGAGGSSDPNEVKSIPPSDNIYCKNLPSGLSEDGLRQLFSPYGEVVTSRVLYQGDSTGQGGAALVRMASTDDASRAVQALQGRELFGAMHPLVVRFADNAEIKAKKQAKHVPTVALAGPTIPPKQAVHQQQQHHHPMPVHTPVGVSLPNQRLKNQPPPPPPPSFIAPSKMPMHLQQPLIFGPYSAGGSFFGGGPLSYQGYGSQKPGPPVSAYNGAMTSGMGPSNSYSQPQRPPPGHGMGPQGQPEDLYRAFPQQIPASLSPVALEGGKSAAAAAGMMGVPSGAIGKPGGLNLASSSGPTGGMVSLYVKNLPPDADRLFLYEKFAPFGAVVSVKILSDDLGGSKGVGFVNYADAVSASKAVAVLHNLVVGDRVLHVAFQNRKS